MKEDIAIVLIPLIVIIILLIIGFHIVLTEMNKINPFIQFSEGIDVKKWLLTSEPNLSIIRLEHCSDVMCWYEITYSDLSKCAFGINSINGRIFNPSYTQIFNLSKTECFRYG